MKNLNLIFLQKYLQYLLYIGLVPFKLKAGSKLGKLYSFQQSYQLLKYALTLSLIAFFESLISLR
jgi:hypothetical protein